MKRKVFFPFFLLGFTRLAAQQLPPDTSSYALIRNRINDQTIFLKLDSTSADSYLQRGF